MEKWITGVFLILCSWEDIDRREISLRKIGFFGILGMLIRIPGGADQLMIGVLGGGLGILLLLVAYLTRESIGYGDGLAVGVIGVWLGFWGAFEVLFFGLAISAIMSLALLVIKHTGRKYEMPFLPFLLAGWMIYLVIGMKEVI